MTGLTRQQAAEAVASLFGTNAVHSRSDVYKRQFSGYPFVLVIAMFAGYPAFFDVL